LRVCYDAPYSTLTIRPARKFRGRFRLPGDKSISHRLAILGALAEGETHIRNFSTAADCASTLGCLEGLGVAVRREGGDVVVAGLGPEGWHAPRAPLDAGNSGSTLRMLAGALAGRPFRSVLTGDASLRRRPVERIAAPLRAMGARVSAEDGRPPLVVDGGPLHGVAWDSPVASAQVKTALLLAGLDASGSTSVREPAQSRDHTERLLPLFGAQLERDERGVTVRGGARLRGIELEVPGDVSSAAFLVVAALVLPDSELTLEGVLLNPLRTAFLDVLREMGGSLEVGVVAERPEPVGYVRARSSRLVGVRVDPARVPALIDEVPALAVAGAFATGRFGITGAKELRVKESDRIAALAEGLTRLGARVEELPDGLVVHGGRPLHGADLEAKDDHRIAMALSIAALGASGESRVLGARCAAVSFPEFFSVLASATGKDA
jgi:3-phosphoshikimate 1-carboxyvinyltransferase